MIRKRWLDAEPALDINCGGDGLPRLRSELNSVFTSDLEGQSSPSTIFDRIIHPEEIGA